MSGGETLTLEAARDLVAGALMAAGTAEANAASVAAALVAAEADGQKGHGLSRVASYAGQVKTGKVQGTAVPRIEQLSPAAIRVDAGAGFAFPALDLARTALVEMAKSQVVALAAVYSSHHFGQGGYHVERLAAEGLVALMLGNSPQAIAPWGGTQGLFGTNPIALAAPRREGAPLVIDLSLAKVARGKVMAAAKAGETIPEGWALDAEGQPTRDPEAALGGTMIPMGEAKGAALAMLVEVLSASLVGANHGFEASSFFTAEGPPPGVGQLLLAFNPGPLSGGGFVDRLETLIGALEDQPGARLPGSRRLAARQAAARDGLVIAASTLAEIRAI
ncbi:Ldh family oxidoreductase [Pelagibius sp.]|uniref:Ldh family oxidoreductase n=1 Tax=Pelagibius sp. TaxID=1931238 RepID=UPI002601E24E|nr:Ldh family oxidoreductase [Pelagibius sp.]